jgi:transcription initiation factor TFIIH subunit 3
MAMCYANRQDASQRALSSSSTRVVCVQGSADHSGQYIPVMNCIFSAQRSSIAIDACVLGENNESAFLQQAAHITGGAYYVARDPHELTQRLLTVSSLDADTRHRALRETRNARGVDFRASCFCHKKPLDAGFVCSVCLSVYCATRGACQTCDAQFED